MKFDVKKKMNATMRMVLYQSHRGNPQAKNLNVATSKYEMREKLNDRCALADLRCAVGGDESRTIACPWNGECHRSPEVQPFVQRCIYNEIAEIFAGA
jgi:hypothetical protein